MRCGWSSNTPGGSMPVIPPKPDSGVIDPNT